MPFKNGLELTELQNMKTPEDDNISNSSNELIEVDSSQINSHFIADRESRRSLTNSHLEKKKCDDYSPGTASIGMSVFNLSNAIMGSGILGLAYALANTGIVLFVLLLISVTLLSVYSINLLLKCSQETGCMVYEKLGKEAFGTPGQLAVFGSTTLQNTGAMLSYLFIVKKELPTVVRFLMGKEESFEAWYLDGRILVVLVTILIILPLCLLKNLGYLGYTSGFSLSCMFFFLIVVIYNKFQIKCGSMQANGTTDSIPEDMCSPKYFTYNSKTVYALPTIAFAFVCHPSVLPIYSELRDRSQKKMQLVSNLSFFAMFVMYLMTAMFGYLTFFSKVQSELLHTYENKKDILILTVRMAVIIAVILTVPVLFFTVRSSLFEMAGKKKYIFWQHLLVTICLLTVISSLVIAIPSMEVIFGVVGVTSANMLIFILPSSLYLKITKGTDGLFKDRLWAYAFLALGLLFSLVSIPLVIYDSVISKGFNPPHDSANTATEIDPTQLQEPNVLLNPNGQPLFDPDELQHPRSAEWAPADHVAQYISLRVRKPLDKLARSKLRAECPRPTVPNSACATPDVDPKIIQFLSKTGWKPKKGFEFALRNCQDKILDIMGPLTQIFEMAETAVSGGTPVDPNVLRGWAQRAICANSAVATERQLDAACLAAPLEVPTEDLETSPPPDPPCLMPERQLPRSSKKEVAPGRVGAIECPPCRDDRTVLPPREINFSLQDRQMIDAEVRVMLEKGAICPVLDQPTAFISNIFILPKKGGGSRLVINLRNLNMFVSYHHFKMEGIHCLRDLLLSGDWMVKLDLQDAYLTVPIAREHQDWLQFRWDHQTWRFTCLSFGLSSAPWCFTKLLKPVVCFLRRKRVRLIIYLDDLLTMSQEVTLLNLHLKWSMDLLQSLGFLISWDKSMLVPSQKMEFLGFLIDSNLGSLHLPPDKVKLIKKEIRKVLTNPVVQVRQLARIIGLL
ncbi:sodium-coupled neutral amino acid symporter 1-like [Pelodytes ibericus]